MSALQERHMSTTSGTAVAVGVGLLRYTALCIDREFVSQSFEFRENSRIFDTF